MIDSMHANILVSVMMLCYFVALLTTLFGVTRNNNSWRTWGLKGTLLAFLVHSFYLAYRVIVTGVAPYRSSYGSMLIVAWVLTLILILVEYRHKLDIAGVFVLPVVLLLLGLGQILPEQTSPAHPEVKSALLNIHIIVALIGYASFAFAFAGSIMYQIQEYHLKQKKLDGLYPRLPSLALCDKLNRYSIEAGYPFFTLAIVLGGMLSYRLQGVAFRPIPKVLVAVFCWLFYSVSLFLRLHKGWRGRKAAYLSIIGFVIILVTYFGVNYLVLGVGGVQV